MTPTNTPSSGPTSYPTESPTSSCRGLRVATTNPTFAIVSGDYIKDVDYLINGRPWWIKISDPYSRLITIEFFNKHWTIFHSDNVNDDKDPIIYTGDNNANPIADKSTLPTVWDDNGPWYNYVSSSETVPLTFTCYGTPPSTFQPTIKPSTSPLVPNNDPMWKF